MGAKTGKTPGNPSGSEQAQPTKRTVPMKVLCMGYGRTGTRSLREALLILGFHHTYHTYDAINLKPYDCKFWVKALTAKYDGVGQVPGRQKFDEILGHCQAVADMPAAYFAPELVKAYPDAKVILTMRDIDKWEKSVKDTLQSKNHNVTQAILGTTAKILMMPDRWVYPLFIKLNRVLYDCDFKKNGRKSREQHYDLVRSLVPPERLLEYHVSEGWEPLCKFLDKPTPVQQEIPVVNETAHFKKMVDNQVKKKVKAQGKRVLDIAAYAALAAALGVWARVVMMRSLVFFV